MKRTVILVGHGSPPSDCPRELVTRLKALEGRRAASGGPPSAEERELDAKIRAWPRTPENDPYRAGVEIPEALEPLRAEHPSVELRYAWPFELAEVARLLAAQVARSAG